MLIKIAANAVARRDVLDIGNIFRAKAVDVSDHTITLEVNLPFSIFNSEVTVGSCSCKIIVIVNAPNHWVKYDYHYASHMPWH